jgi:hypothetical protein
VETVALCVPNAISYTEVGLFSSKGCLKSMLNCHPDVLDVYSQHECGCGRILVLYARYLL